MWVAFVKELVGNDSSPILHQHATHQVFKLVVREKIKLESSTVTNTSHLTQEEEDTLRCVCVCVVMYAEK